MNEKFLITERPRFPPLAGRDGLQIEVGGPPAWALSIVRLLPDAGVQRDRVGLLELPDLVPTSATVTPVGAPRMVDGVAVYECLAWTNETWPHDCGGRSCLPHK